MRASTLRHTITIEKLVRTEDGMGGFLEEWTPLLEGVSAALWPKKGTEQVEQGQKMATLTHQIRIRYRDGVDETCRVKFKGREFEVISALNWEERNVFLDLYCEEKR